MGILFPSLSNRYLFFYVTQCIILAFPPLIHTLLIQCHEDICAEIKSYKKAAEASKELTCAICFEVVLEKEDKKQRK